MINATGLDVILRLDDQLTAGASKAFGSIQKQVEKTTQSFAKMGREISQLGKNMVFLGAAITGPMGIAFATASKYSIEVGDSLKSLTASAVELQMMIGNAMVPVVDKVSQAINNLNRWLQSLDPQMRNAIIQGVLITGILLTVGGAIVNIVGKMASLIARLAQFAMANAPLLIMVGILIAIIIYWDKVKIVVLPIIQAMQILVDMAAIGFLKLADAVLWVMDQFTNFALKLKPLIDMMERLHIIPSETANSWRAGLSGMATSVDDARTQIQGAITGLEQDMQTAMSGGGWAATVDESVIGIQEKFQGLKEFFSTDFLPSMSTSFQQFSQNFAATFKTAYDNATNLGAQSSQILTSSIQQFSTGFGNAVANMIVHGKNFGESMKAVFENLAVTFISAIVSMIVQWVIFQAIQLIFWPMISAVAGAVAASMSAIWAVPAALASLATFGGNSAPAMAGIGATVAFSKGVSMLAEGGSLLSGGSVLVGERGPELLDLPGGARVTPLDNVGGGVSVHIAGDVYAQTADQIDDLAERISRLVDEKRRARV